MTDNIITVQSYLQALSKTGIKFKIETLNLDNNFLSSQTTDYQATSTVKNEWDICLVNKTFDKTTTGNKQDRVQ